MSSETSHCKTAAQYRAVTSVTPVRTSLGLSHLFVY
jgi:hypothetical protein